MSCLPNVFDTVSGLVQRVSRFFTINSHIQLQFKYILWLKPFKKVKRNDSLSLF